MPDLNPKRNRACGNNPTPSHSTTRVGKSLRLNLTTQSPTTMAGFKPSKLPTPRTVRSSPLGRATP